MSKETKQEIAEERDYLEGELKAIKRIHSRLAHLLQEMHSGITWHYLEWMDDRLRDICAGTGYNPNATTENKQ